MIEITCICGAPLQIAQSLTLGSTTTIKIEPCEACENAPCIQEICDKFSELEDELQGVITQQHIDIEGNDKMLQKIRKLAEKLGQNLVK